MPLSPRSDKPKGQHLVSEADPDSRQTFTERGWIGPFPLLSPTEADRLCKLYLHTQTKFAQPSRTADWLYSLSGEPLPWFKSLHAYIGDFYDVATDPLIVDRVKALLGPDLLCWGAGVTVSKPGKKHRWHVDVEHRRSTGVTAFVGLTGINHRSTLQVMDGTHKLSAVPQELSFSTVTELSVAAAESGCRGDVISVSMKVGDFFLFDGRLWHGSDNLSDETRFALILQYAAPNHQAAIPLSWDEPIIWDASRPPCVLVSGVDRFQTNALVGRPCESF